MTETNNSLNTKAKNLQESKFTQPSLLWKQDIQGPLYRSPNVKEKQIMPGSSKSKYSLPIKGEKKAKPLTCPWYKEVMACGKTQIPEKRFNSNH